MNQRLSRILLCGLLLVSSACSKKLTTQPVDIPATAIERPGADPEHGRRSGPAQIIVREHGAIFALFRPEHWNRILIVYVHGYIPPNAPIALPTADFIDPLRERLLSEGYAVAYSSWSENGFAVKDAIQQSELTRELFKDRLGRPRRVFLIGQSLGGLVALALAERRPEDYSGALVLSPISGGSRREIAYNANVRVLFDHFYPGVLPGDLLHLPQDLNLNRDLIGPALAAIQANPNGIAAMSQIHEVPIPFRDPSELVSSIIQALVFHGLELHDLLARTNGQSFFDNSRTVYTSETLPAPLLADLNNRIARFQIGREAARFLERYYEPSGDLEVPVLALHNAFDPVAPIFNAEVYRERARSQGSSDLLEQRVFPRYGHVGFSADEMAGAFEDLVQKVRRHKRADDDAIAGLDRVKGAAAPEGNGAARLGY
jgi:pimeloyl-ACP methyl ester carboxylesterase